MKYLRQFSVILSISFLGELLEYLIPLPVSAGIYGLVLLLAGLVTKIIPLKAVEGAADFLVEIMPVLFIPAMAGIMTSWEAMRELLLPLTVIIVVTTILIMVVTGRVSQGLIRSQRARENLNKTVGEEEAE
ncbi:CidA/LrgA family protein [Candidatus Acetatifactor stercoripullorum]|uniref:CidA/LrgA family protein n=1 Tax=Candidatus Acetatifactor stercoripullorum TaxID=2838414 RepID=UPI00298DE63E|nr:CidA/LrgA family protein [Candidatus Acetatifactor stercoripullorum]